MCFESSKLDITKYKVRNFKIFKTNILSSHLAENGKEKVFSNDYSFLSNLKNVKTNTILTI